MAVADRNAKTRRSQIVPVCAIGTLLLAAVACLNPMPDDFPNDVDSPPEQEAGGSSGEGTGGGVVDGQAGGTGSPSTDDGSSPEAPRPVEGDAGPPGVDAPDAGCGPAPDAGAADAGSRLEVTP